MPQDANAHFDSAVLDLIEHSPTGAVPFTPAYRDALSRLYSSHQVYAHADHKEGHVTARSLGKAPLFHAVNLGELIAGTIPAEALESNKSIFDRYVMSLPADRRAKAEAWRTVVAGKVAHHRAKHGVIAVHDPIQTLLLVPGAGPHPGLPGNYLYGSAFQLNADPGSRWGVHLHDSDDADARFDAASMSEALKKVEEVLASAPFTLAELEALGFHLN